MDRRAANPNSWTQKFRHAFRGLKQGVRGQSSFFVHFFATAAVVIAAVVLECSRAEWLVLVICITLVWVAEMFNSALEALARAVRRADDPDIADALDIASAAVLLAALGAVIVGVLVFAQHLRWPR